jgi:uncharacterized membrane protein
MIRKQLIASKTSGEPGFRWRREEVTRLEGFTDAVFAFAVTLLVVSLEVPKTVPELFAAMHGFIAFGFCFALLANVWYEHYRYFRRYGLENPWVIFLNCALLFFVLFYVYPLKFIFATAFDGAEMSAPDGRSVITIFSFGSTAVFTVFALLYLYAWRIRTQLELTTLEALRTRVSLTDQCAMVILGLLSLLLAWTLPDRYLPLAGYIYFLVPIYFTIAHSISGRQERRLPSAPPSV